MISYIGLDNGKKGWIESNSGLLNQPPRNSDIYIAAIYWTMTTFTTVGYGDFTASSEVTNEYLFQCLTILAGIGFFGYIVGNVRTVFVETASLTNMKEMFEENFNLWLIRLNKANKIKILGNDYFSYGASSIKSKWDRDYTSLKNNEFFLNLRPRMQYLLADRLFDSVYKTYSSFFEGTEAGFRRAIVHNMEFETLEFFPPYVEDFSIHSFVPDQTTTIIQQNKIPNKIIFVHHGEVYGSNATGRYIYFRLIGGAYFGEGYVLSQIPSTYSINYFKQSSVSLFSVKSDVFLKICQVYPKSMEIIKKRSVLRRLEYKKLKLNAIEDIIKETLLKEDNLDHELLREEIYGMIMAY